MFYPLPLNQNPYRIKISLKCLLILVAILTATSTFAQVGIGTDTPAASAALEVSSSTNNKGILIPRVTATQKDAISNPAEGLMVYQTSAPAGFYYYTGNTWKLMVTQTDIDLKVTKVTGKDLSSNDYTSAEKTKVSKFIRHQYRRSGFKCPCHNGFSSIKSQYCGCKYKSGFKSGQGNRQGFIKQRLYRRWEN